MVSVHQAEVLSAGGLKKLGAEQLSQLSEYIDQQSRRLAIGGRLQGTIFKRISNEEFGVAYELSNVYRLLRELGFSWITSRSRHPKQDGQVQEADFKNFQPVETILNIPGHVAGEPMSMSGFRTKPGLVNKGRLPDCGPGVAV